MRHDGFFTGGKEIVISIFDSEWKISFLKSLRDAIFVTFSQMAHYTWDKNTGVKSIIYWKE